MKSNKLPYASDGVRYIIGALLLSGISIISLNAQEALKGETQEAVVMSPFEVKSTEESGYRVTDSKTATGIAMELSKTPLSIQVISVDFLEDLNLDSMNEALRYSSGIMIDEFNRDASGVRIRGFQSTTFYRNGVRRSSGPYTDSVDRVEVIKGPSLGNPSPADSSTILPRFQNSKLVVT
jgi:iron complex outermembrane recepter protein